MTCDCQTLQRRCKVETRRYAVPRAASAARPAQRLSTIADGVQGAGAFGCNPLGHAHRNTQPGRLPCQFMSCVIVCLSIRNATSPKRKRTGNPVRDPDQMRPGATRNPVSCAGGESPGGNRDWQALCRKGVKPTSAERTPGLQHPAHSPEPPSVHAQWHQTGARRTIFAQLPCNNRSKLSLARCSSPSCIASSRSCSGAISTSSSSLNFWRN